MANIGHFNANEQEPVSFGVLPAGDYTIAADESEVREARSGEGHYLSVRFSVVDGEFQGRKLWDRFTLSHSNEKAVQVGRGKLSGLCRAAGKLEIGDSAELHGIPVSARVKIRPAQGEYDEQNEITSYRAIEGATSTPAKPAPKNGGGKPGTARPAWLKGSK